MTEEQLSLITQQRRAAEDAGLAAIDAISRGDIGLARSLARQAAQWARVVVQLETGEKQSGPSESSAAGAVGDSQPAKV
jgi:hypothetical protein